MADESTIERDAETQALVEAKKPFPWSTCVMLVVFPIVIAGLLASTIVFAALYTTKPLYDVVVSYFEPEMKFGHSHCEELQMGESFRILNLADVELRLHFNDVDKTTISELIERTNPDLITLTGDEFEDSAKRYGEEFTEFMDSFGVYWAPVHGNHDRQEFSNEELGHIYEQGKYCLYRNGFELNVSGRGNYIISLMRGNDNVYNLIMLDSGAVIDEPDVPWEYEYIHEDEIAWYEWAVNGLRERYAKEVKSIVFEHIPVPEYKLAAENIIFGEKHENVSSPHTNTGFFDAMLRQKSTTHMIVGHDHENNYFGEYKGIILGYALKTGKNSYHMDELNGGTLITVSDAGIAVEHVYLNQ